MFKVLNVVGLLKFFVCSSSNILIYLYFYWRVVGMGMGVGVGASLIPFLPFLVVD